MIIMMCDGSSHGNPGESRIGVVIWKRTANNTRSTTPFKIISESIGMGTNNDAEWQAIIKAMEFAREYKNHPVFIYSDSMLAVQQACGKWRIRDDRMKQYKSRFDNLSSGMDITVSWLPRQLTVLADRQT